MLRYDGQFLKLALFLQTLEMKITTEIQRNVKLLHLLNEKVICSRLTEKKYNFAPILDTATLAAARVNEKIASGFRTNMGRVR